MDLQGQTLRGGKGLHVLPAAVPLSARESRGRITPGGNIGVLASAYRIASRQGSEYEFDGEATSSAASGRHPLSPRGIVANSYGESEQPMTKKEFEKARKRKEAESKHQKLEELRRGDLEHMKEVAARKQRNRDLRCESMLDSILSSDGVRGETEAIVGDHEERMRHRTKDLYKKWDSEVAQRMDHAVMKFMNHEIPPLPAHFNGREQLLSDDDPLKKVFREVEAEEGFKKAAEIILTPRCFGSLRQDIARREFIEESVAKRDRCRPMLPVPMWEQRAHYASQLGYFIQSIEKGGPHHCSRRTGEGKHMIDESDCVVAAGKTKNRFEKNKMEMLVGKHAKEGQAKAYKREDGHSCGAPCQDHYSYEKGNEVVEREFPPGKRMYPMLRA